jgi:hypothetical protein
MVPYDCLVPTVFSGRVSMFRVGGFEDTIGDFPFAFEVKSAQVMRLILATDLCRRSGIGGGLEEAS